MNHPVEKKSDLPMKKRLTRSTNRGRVAARVQVILKQRMPECYSKRVPIMTKVVEAKLYKYAPSIESYSDLSTLERRVTALAKAVILHEQMKKQGIPPDQRISVATCVIKNKYCLVAPPSAAEQTGKRQKSVEVQRDESSESGEKKESKVAAEKKTLETKSEAKLLSLPLHKNLHLMDPKNAAARSSLLDVMSKRPYSANMGSLTKSLSLKKSHSLKPRSKLSVPRSSVRDILSGSAPVPAVTTERRNPQDLLQTLERALSA